MAFWSIHDIWTQERACQILETAWSTGQPLKILADKVAEKTAQDREKMSDFSRQHFEEMKQLMIANDASVRVIAKKNASLSAGIYLSSKSLHQLFG